MMMFEATVAEQTCKHRERVAGQRLIHKGLLAFQALQRTATWNRVVVERRIDNLWKQLGFP